MLGQLPLPLLPAGSAEIAPGVGLVTGADGGGLVIVHGLATFAWDGGDEACRRLAAVQLVRLRAASQGQVAQDDHLNRVGAFRRDQDRGLAVRKGEVGDDDGALLLVAPVGPVAESGRSSTPITRGRCWR